MERGFITYEIYIQPVTQSRDKTPFDTKRHCNEVALSDVLCKISLNFLNVKISMKFSQISVLI